MKECVYVISGTAETNGQEHLYIETQGAYALPVEGAYKIYSSTQGPTAVQRHAADVLGISMSRIEVDVTTGRRFWRKRGSGHFLGCFCALAAFHLKRPVKYSLHRMEDMRMTGKRNPYSSDFTIGLDKDLNILAYEATFHQNAGASADLSPAVLERTLFHCTNSYYIPMRNGNGLFLPDQSATQYGLPGFWRPQGMFVIEAAIHKAVETIGVPATVIQQKNLIATGQQFPYGQVAVSEAAPCWKKRLTAMMPAP